MSTVGVVFPHQLFEDSILATRCETIYIVEEQLYFLQWKFHKQKIAFHRATMKFYENYLQTKSRKVVYIESSDPLADLRKLIPFLKTTGIETLEYIDTTDLWLEQRMKSHCEASQITAIKHNSQLFLNTAEDITHFFASGKKMFQADFYKFQRQKRKLLLKDGENPIGGRWSFDDENRKKYPKGRTAPIVDFPEPNDFYREAAIYTEKYFSGNYGELNNDFIFPTTFAESKNWLQTFLETRFSEFGLYEDAIVGGENILHHGVLSPLLNTGLLSPRYVIEEVMQYASKHSIPLNTVEGFIRQLIGWREFIRAAYQLNGTEQRTKNYWKFSRRIPESFWNGTTGIEPVDITIRKVLATGYCHHIERLMVLGNFMMLCEFDPDDVYHWFMELFIDAYDWVMVPNVYGMSQFADGGLITTKPYLSGSNYLMNMSDYKKGPWQAVWNGLFWRFISTQQDFFKTNPRWSMLVKSWNNMKKEKQQEHLDAAENYLRSL